ncbi:hypothetical protein D9611_007319 [Ephemerocybe angulata]|uniref:Protein kinase domain-containing protein n=1 Tax=Ephemerocybe angulata TaxID=980116 RepID=A0A8H5CFB9_9AGAR|nr:hypothetical protein D9611_007319 [Tulosesus angulatus]
MSLNNLVTLARSYEGSPNKGSVLKAIMDILTSNEPIDTHQHLAQVAGSDAQDVMDGFQHIIQGSPPLEVPLKARILDAMTRLAPKGAIPSAMLIEVDQINPSTFYQAPCADVYKGNKAGRLLCLKTYRAHERFTSANVIELRDVLHGVEYLHDNCISHGDIKGDNILIKPSGRACIADFGLARVLSNLDSAPGSTVLMGTLEWQAPEILEAQLDDNAILPTAASDVYTGHPPFANLWKALDHTVRGWKIMEEVALHDQRPAKPLDSDDAFQRFGLTNQIWNLAETCWAREVGLRPSATQLLGSSLFNVSV